MAAERGFCDAGPMRKILELLFAVALTLCSGCANLNFFSEERENSLGIEAYAEAVKEYPQITSGADYEMVQRVGRRIAEASGKQYEWEFRLLRADEMVNAFCLPGGKVAIYTGILKFTKDENGLAAVMGHEVAHATMRHGGKRMTNTILLSATLAAVGAGLSMSKMSDEEQAGVMAAFGLGAQVGIALPYSRGHETEADVEGVRYAIRAGYDPYAAVRLWERMAEGKESGPSWLSTHPDSMDRARKLEAEIPRILLEEGKPAPTPSAPTDAPKKTIRR